jgi:hypothetical protein
MAVPVSTYLTIAGICQYLSADGSSKNLAFKGNTTRPNQSRLIYMVRSAVQWQYDIDPNNADLPQMANYMYSLCNPYVSQAQIISNAGVAGSVINPSTGSQVTIATPSYQFKVGEVGALMTAGETTLTITLSGIVNPSAEITLDGVEVPYGRSDVISYTATYNATNIVIVFNQAVSDGQLYLIHLIQLVNV